MVTPLQTIGSRRQLLQSATCGIGYLALMGLCKDSLAVGQGKSPLQPKVPHHPARAKQLIFLHMRGGPSAMETFERKPELDAQAGKVAKSKSRKLTPSHWKWRQRGGSGLWVSDLFPHQAEHADDLCVLSGMHTDISNHTPAMLQLHTGSFAFTRPSMGAWILYGLGTENQDLPGFVSLCPPLINGGAKNYGSAFLPAIYQGTAIGDIKTPIQDAKIGNIENGRLTHRQQRRQLDLIQAMNRSTATAHPEDSQIDGVIESFELAFRMQAEVPTVFDISGETQSTLDRYGIGEKKPSDNFGRQCLLARRMIESGVRVVEVCDEFWDQHNNLVKGHESRAAATDQPIGALLADLKERGMLDDTLVVWGGEFGRTPDTAQKTLDGRDHNAKGYTMWLAGGGVRGGFQHGKTDELGYEAVEGRVHLHDLHATILHLLGLDHKQLTYRYAGRDFRLTDVHGVVVDEVLG
ncbi:hypothetical protein KOR42_04590 [Thalassoglobus neptunius]|uniref:Sulfatase n=1 Tax=Thalassoglobus neptunius TaxID=1938619 RepID=A0A5C5X452_9PLAN|nr:DUF1501 domain-containing protein [Thalassoglobus neptunius]TWT57101.1 hypothetical protein KOR42_04590 [Thalassoglobus neptunius]